MVPINYYAVLVSALIMMGLGALWYGPLFGKRWQSLMGFTDEHMSEAKAQGMAVSYGVMAIGALVMSFVLAHSIVFATNFMKATGLLAGLQAGFWNWLGFIVPVSLGSVLWEGKPWTLWAINAGYYLVGLLLVGALLALWI